MDNSQEEDDLGEDCEYVVSTCKLMLKRLDRCLNDNDVVFTTETGASRSLKRYGILNGFAVIRELRNTSLKTATSENTSMFMELFQ